MKVRAYEVRQGDGSALFRDRGRAFQYAVDHGGEVRELVDLMDVMAEQAAGLPPTTPIVRAAQVRAAMDAACVPIKENDSE